MGTFLGSTTSPTAISLATFNASWASSTAVAIACGGNHTVVVCADGIAYTTGMNTYGQLGRVQNVARSIQFGSVVASTGVATVWLTGDCAALYAIYATQTMFMTFAGKLLSLTFGALDASGLSRNATVSRATNNGTAFVAGIVPGSLPIAATTSAGAPMTPIVELAGFGLPGKWPNQATFSPCLPLGTNAVPVEMACGDNHTALLMKNGSIQSFGRNNAGQLGVTGADRFQPARASAAVDPQSVVAVGAATNTTFAELLDDVRSVTAYGEFFAINYAGMLGGATSFSVFLTTSGTLYDAGNRYYGQLGDNYTGSTNASNQLVASTAVTSQGSLAPLAAAGARIVSIATCIFNDPGHTVAVDSLGRLHAWGYNNNGQLGLAAGNVTNAYVPVIVNVSSGTSSLSGKAVVAVSCGATHTVALDSLGRVHAWGDNAYGQLGMAAGNIVQRYVPQPVNVDMDTSSLYGKTVVAVVGGGSHTVALDSLGQVHAWGMNTYGQLGMADGDVATRYVPQAVNGTSSLTGQTVIALACGVWHTVAVDSIGQVHVWGTNTNGELGIAVGDTTARYLPTKVNVASGTSSLYGKTVVALACGQNHTVALDSLGQVHVWGSNNNGQLGIAAGDTTARYVPHAVNVVSGESSLYGMTIVAVAGGSSHTLALDSLGQVHAWGNNSNGQLLDGTTTQRGVPYATGIYLWSSSSAVSGGTTPLMLNFTGQHRCFIAVDGVEGLSASRVRALEGLVVVSDRGTYVDPTLSTRTTGPTGANDALPVVSLCSVARDKRAFGVVSASVDMGVRANASGQLVPVSDPGDMAELVACGDVRAQINAIGDGAIWVVETAGGCALGAGDLVTTSAVKGYGQAQEDDCMRACTVAKLTMSCDFSPTMVLPERVELVNGLATIDGATGGPVWVTTHAVGTPQYKLRYVTVVDGTETTQQAWSDAVAAGDGRVLRAALLGCTYHSG
jgi:alpha-tubulin suppressor-like RCC1 family protein